MNFCIFLKIPNSWCWVLFQQIIMVIRLTCSCSPGESFGGNKNDGGEYSTRKEKIINFGEYWCREILFSRGTSRITFWYRKMVGNSACTIFKFKELFHLIEYNFGMHVRSNSDLDKIKKKKPDIMYVFFKRELCSIMFIFWHF